MNVRLLCVLSLLLLTPAMSTAEIPRSEEALLCPPCAVPMTTDEWDALNDMMNGLQNCNDYDCHMMGNMMASTMNFTYMDDDWSCQWHSQGCAGEAWMNGDAWVSRSGGDGLGSAAEDEAVIAAHETGHVYFQTSNEELIDDTLSYCLMLMGWGQ